MTPAPPGYTGTLTEFPDSAPVPPEQCDWRWAAYESRRRPLVRLVLRTKGRRCHLCGQLGATTADHVIPWSHGGPNTLANLEPAHAGCNFARRDKTLAEWFAVRPLVPAPSLQPSRSW